jgi:hypothetical protein
MKRIVLLVGLFFGFSALYAQNPYIVKTRGASKTAAASADSTSNEEKVHDFVSDNFKYYSLCDWQEGMKFMVLPEKYDLIVNTFSDASTNTEVSNGSLREKIMIYKGHTQTPQGRYHINFTCQDDRKDYYYEIPNGTFDDYCGDKMGVPTLAYLGDVDIARNKLMGVTLYTLADIYRVDNDANSAGYDEVAVPKNTEVKVVAIGAGTRSFPVKIIVEDNKGREFYQNVAMSKTNSGMREEEFGTGTDNTKFLFKGSFLMADATVAAGGQYGKYIGKSVYTKRSTIMQGPKGNVTIARSTEFVIKGIQSIANTSYVNMTLKAVKGGVTYTKKVTFKNTDNVAGDIDGFHEDYYFELFGSGSLRSNHKGISAVQWKAISQNKVIVGMNKDAVRLAKGDAASSYDSAKTGTATWLYEDKTVIKFNKSGRVIKVEKH